MYRNKVCITTYAFSRLPVGQIFIWLETGTEAARKTLSTVKNKVASFLLLTSNYDLHILLIDKHRCPLKSFKHEITGIHWVQFRNSSQQHIAHCELCWIFYQNYIGYHGFRIPIQMINGLSTDNRNIIPLIIKRNIMKMLIKISTFIQKNWT